MQTLKSKSFRTLTNFKQQPLLQQKDSRIKLRSESLQPLQQPALTTNTSKVLNFELTCAAQCIQLLEIATGKQSTQPQNQLHNHKRLKKQSNHNYIQEDLPKFNENHKQSCFELLFLSTQDRKFRGKIIQHEQKKCQQQLVEYLKQQQECKVRQKQLKPAHKRNQPTLSLIIKQQKPMIYEQKQGRTRLQKKQQQQSSYILIQQKAPFPDPKHYYCYPCRSTYQDYILHIELQTHKQNIRNTIGQDYIKEQIEKFANDKNQEINSKQFKDLVELRDFLAKIVTDIKEKLKLNRIRTNQQIQKLVNEKQMRINSFSNGKNQQDIKSHIR